MLADCISARRRTWLCLLVLLVAVAGIVTGILAMHVVSTPVSQSHSFGSSGVVEAASSGSHMDASPVSQSHATTPTASDTGMDGGCSGGGCDPMRDMTVMVCTLALLATTILLVAPALRRALLGIGSHAGPMNLLGPIGQAAESLPPPSLVALSVDRR